MTAVILGVMKQTLGRQFQGPEMFLIICHPGSRAVRKCHQEMSVMDREPGCERGLGGSSGEDARGSQSRRNKHPAEKGRGVIAAMQGQRCQCQHPAITSRLRKKKAEFLLLLHLKIKRKY